MICLDKSQIILRFSCNLYKSARKSGRGTRSASSGRFYGIVAGSYLPGVF